MNDYSKVTNTEEADIYDAPDESWLTTLDNPYDPFTQFDDWYRFDEEEKHYCTCGLIARFLKSSNNLSEALVEEDVNDAITRILNIDFENKYKRVVNKNAKIVYLKGFTKEDEFV